MSSSPNFIYIAWTGLLHVSCVSFHHWVPWRSAKTVSKECWGPCHGWIPSLWDFAQTYSPQIERRYQNWRGTFYSLDSAKAVEPCISLSWSTFDWAALVVQVCDEICRVCQLGRPLFQPRTPWHDIKPLPEWKVEKVEDFELSAVRRKAKPFQDSILGFEGEVCRFARESLPTKIGKGRHWTSVFFCSYASNAPRFVQGQANCYFQMKKLGRTTEPIAHAHVEWKACWVQRANMWPHCSLTAVQFFPFHFARSSNLSCLHMLSSQNTIVAGTKLHSTFHEW